MAADDGSFAVIRFFMALLSFVGFDTPSLTAQGQQRLPPNFQQRPGHPPAMSARWQGGHGSKEFRHPVVISIRQCPSQLDHLGKERTVADAESICLVAALPAQVYTNI